MSEYFYTKKEAEKAILVGVALQSENISYNMMCEYLDELAFLAETAGAETVKIFTQNLDKPVTATFVGKGKLEEIKTYVEDNDINLIIFDDELSPTQIRNLERELKGRKVLDRTNLILDIFAKRARTAEAKAQVELAQYQYLLPRLTGMWTHLERQKGGIGLRGPGESEIETDRRIIRDKITRLKEQLAKIDKQMVTQRKNRGKLVRVALVGYTNVGKSTLMKAALGLLPYTGSITVDGPPVTRKTLPEVRRKLGYVLQDADNQMFMPTVLDDMVFGPMNYGLSRAAAEQRAEETLAELHMEYLRDRHNHKMSGGEKRMAAVATILAMQPQMLLMDEPSTALDPRNRRTLIRVLRQRPETKLIASHDLDLVLETCSRVLLLAGGRLAADGAAGEILRDRTLLEENGLELPLCLAGVPDGI